MGVPAPPVCKRPNRVEWPSVLASGCFWLAVTPLRYAADCGRSEAPMALVSAFFFRSLRADFGLTPERRPPGLPRLPPTAALAFLPPAGLPWLSS